MVALRSFALAVLVIGPLQRMGLLLYLLMIAAGSLGGILGRRGRP
jgi:hypothetical protein